MDFRTFTQDYSNFGGTLNLGSALNDFFLYENTKGFNSAAFYITVPVGATVQFQTSFDGVNFVPSTFRSIETDETTQKTSTSGNYIGSISNARKLRIIVIIAGVGIGSVKGRASKEVSVLEGIEHGWRPDNFTNPQSHVDVEFSAITTGGTVWTPDAGKKIVVTNMIVSSDGVNLITIYDETNAVGNVLFKNRFSANATPFSHVFSTPFVSSAIGNIIKLDTTSAATVNITMHGYQID